ncbi:TonB-linked outer membrane protein, SusC/RagA family [Arachidicoccus rhizosphaerae]|uniref:TonB-linked outer membrane protein, SusC/RagA family n=1 Tax=Arachidicoccus rhizosphaerae TaxID=551991 RepID=A0A1H4AKT4_9BACT|nr:SusC/RagA family TonB-linked outer membrane protein [Arachidicoccus rhizosphaerae]SEA36535.1 TonB-linked outer membrane protein, SusC/RagA family [Arachidicoccus rhizosphaerae]
MKQFKFLFFLVPGMLIVMAGYSQQKKYSGTVRNNDGLPLRGVSVLIKDSKTGTMSNDNGQFILSAEAGSTLHLSMIGYVPKDELLSTDTIINVVLDATSDSTLNDVVVIGYGTTTKRDLTGAVSHLDSKVLETKVATSFVDFLKGTIPGVNVAINNGASGGGTLEIRGPASLTASTTPLIILDGVTFNGNLNDINPNDIASIDVLKDASATAIYGAKGSAGVVAITTKRGMSETPRVDFSSKIGVSNMLGIPPAASPEQYLQRRKDYLKTVDYFNPATSQKGEGYYDNPDDLPDGVTQEQWAGYDNGFDGDYVGTWLTRLKLTDIEINNYKAGKTVDWRDYVYQTGFRQDHDVAVSGRSKSTSYYTSIGYTNNKGTTVGDDFKSVHGRFNLESNITKWLQIGTTTQFADRGDNTLTVNPGNADVMSPYGNMYNEDGTLAQFPIGDARVSNPIYAASVNSYFYKVQTLNATLYSKLTLPYGITFRTNWNNRYGWIKTYNYTSDLNAGVAEGGEASRNEYSDYEWSIENILNWSHRFNKVHQIDVTGVIGAEKYQTFSTTASNEGFTPDGDLIFHQLNTGINPVTNSDDEVQTGNSLLGRVNYSFKDRYLLTASIRRDGFSAFGQNNPYGVYPAFAAAWRISQENFMKGSAFNDLKLRASWGTSGNRSIGRYAALGKLNTLDNIEGGETVKGVYQTTLSNKDIKWETTHSIDLGLDFGILNNRFSGTIDAYYNYTTDLLVDRALPGFTGYSSVLANLGQVDNKGLEVTLTSVNVNIPNKLVWSTSLIFSLNRNKIVHLYGTTDSATGKEADDVSNGWYIGHGINDIHDYKITGIWQIGEEEAAAVYGKLPGDPKVLDVDGDGVINNNDKVWIGSSVPRYRASLRSDLQFLKNWNLSFVIRGEFDYYGNDASRRNEDNRYFESSNSIWNDYWTPWNANTSYGRLGSNASNPTVYFYVKRDYLRMQNASLSYTFPDKILRKYSIPGLRLMASVDNAFVITKWSYYDPETMGRTPRIFTFGAYLTL